MHILLMAGSLRQQSYNRQLIHTTIPYLEEQEVSYHLIDLNEYLFPLYNQDYEDNHGRPERVDHLQAEFAQADGFLMSLPEYNGSISGVWKNTIDWVSRPHPQYSFQDKFTGKVASLLAASPGSLGGLRGLRHGREILEGLGVLVIPQQYALSKADQAFDPQGGLLSAHSQEKVEGVVKSFVDTTRAVRKK